MGQSLCLGFKSPWEKLLTRCSTTWSVIRMALPLLCVVLVCDLAGDA